MSNQTDNNSKNSQVSASRHYFSNNFNKNFALQNDSSLQARAIRIINIFRFFLSLIFVVFNAYSDKLNWIDNDNPSLFLSLALVYMIFSITLLIITPLKTPAVMFFHPIQIVIDILFIIIMMHAAGGIQSGLGLLLIISIVTASLVSDGRLALFYASVATIGLLLEQSYQIAYWQLSVSSYTQTAMLSLSCFATASLAYSLAKRILQSEALASSRGLDLENLAQVNELITQEMQDGVLVVDQDLQIRHHNLQAELLLSSKLNLNKLLNLKENIPEIAAILSQWTKGNDNEKECITTVNNKQLNVRIEPINHQNRHLGAVVFIQDWSKIQSAAQQAKLAALGRLTANIAHEIRNPLSAISHANQLLQEDENLNAENARMLQIIADNTQRINQIIKDVLELNRRDRTQQDKINLLEFVTDFHKQFCTIEKIPTTHFILDTGSKKLITNFDSRHLTQILWNLCKNGWEHSHKNIGSLTLRCSLRHKSARDLTRVLQFEVIDDGAGIAESDRNKLFEPFYTTKSTGNGLGLYISRELAEANNAELIYQPLQQGSAFILRQKNAT
jgi:two-component system sensor histidine kinase PilS (NtrC family)